MGGAVISSICAGVGDMRSANRAIAHTLTMLLLATPVIMVVLLVFGQQLLILIGGRDEILAQAQGYLSVMAWGSLFQVMASGFIPLMRNKGKVVLAMCVLVASGIVNVILDYVFICRLYWGVEGAALATIIAQGFVFASGVLFFLKKENRLRRGDFAPSGKFIARTLRGGFAPFALTLLPEVTTLVINVASVANGGATAQAAFAVISYVAVAVQWLIQGVNDGSQPLISVKFGEGDVRAMRALRRTNYVFAIAIGLLGMWALTAFRVQLAQLFGSSPETSEVLPGRVAVLARAGLLRHHARDDFVLLRGGIQPQFEHRDRGRSGAHGLLRDRTAAVYWPRRRVADRSVHPSRTLGPVAVPPAGLETQDSRPSGRLRGQEDGRRGMSQRGHISLTHLCPEMT